MLKRKLSTLILAATITNLVATPANVFAETLTQNNVIQADAVRRRAEVLYSIREGRVIAKTIPSKSYINMNEEKEVTFKR